MLTRRRTGEERQTANTQKAPGHNRAPKARQEKRYNSIGSKAFLRTNRHPGALALWRFGFSSAAPRLRVPMRSSRARVAPSCSVLPRGGGEVR